MAKHGLWIGGLMGFLAVLSGAWGSHGVESMLGELSPQELADKLGIWQIADRYLMYHAIIAVVVGILGQFNRHVLLQWALACFVVGSVIFSGALFLLAVTGQSWLGMVAPVGGLTLMVGWVLLVIVGYGAVQPRRKKKKKEQTA